MNEVESSPVPAKRKGIVLWPSIVTLVPILGGWFLLYHDFLGALLWLTAFFFSVICLLCSLLMVILRRPKRPVSFLIPVLLFTVSALGARDSRDYVEFLIYDAHHHIKAEVRQNGCKYKEWPLQKHSGTYYVIVYDATDAIARRDGVENGGCHELVHGVGGHFYFFRGVCPGIL